MVEDAQHFYTNKLRHSIGLLFIIALFVFFCLFVVFTYREGLYVYTFIFGIVAIITGLLSYIGLGRIFSRNPYITITNTHLIIYPNTKNEMKITTEDIISVEFVEVTFDKRIQFHLRNEEALFQNLSKAHRLSFGLDKFLGVRTIFIQFYLIKRKQRTLFLQTFDRFISSSMHEEEKLDMMEKMLPSSNQSKEKLWNKYDDQPIQKLVINAAYFKKAYLYSLVLFIIMFILFYALIYKDNNYLIYAFFSFVTYPFAKLLLDRFGMYTLRQKIDKQEGITYYIYQALIFFDGVLFHISIYLAPFGLLIFFIDRIKRKRRTFDN